MRNPRPIYLILVCVLFALASCKPTYEKCLQLYGDEASSDTVWQEINSRIPYSVPVPHAYVGEKLTLKELANLYSLDDTLTRQRGRARLSVWRTADEANADPGLRLQADCLPDTIRETVTKRIRVPYSVNTQQNFKPPPPELTWWQQGLMGMGGIALLAGLIKGIAVAAAKFA